jgi:hypothetical protein
MRRRKTSIVKKVVLFHITFVCFAAKTIRNRNAFLIIWAGKEGGWSR